MEIGWVRARHMHIHIYWIMHNIWKCITQFKLHYPLFGLQCYFLLSAFYISHIYNIYCSATTSESCSLHFYKFLIGYSKSRKCSGSSERNAAITYRWANACVLCIACTQFIQQSSIFPFPILFCTPRSSIRASHPRPSLYYNTFVMFMSWMYKGNSYFSI